MPLTSPWAAKSPKKRIKIIDIPYDGTKPSHLEFSIAKLEVSNGKGGVKLVNAIRHDRSHWSKNPDNGYPITQGGNASWFILPDDFKFTIPKKMNRYVIIYKRINQHK
ncbi:hypothetical protein EON73_02235 [bacterium]|nr:MAG: hypothetical protein EON73_02235 [bacterium]